MLETVDLDAVIPKRECKEILGKIDLQLAQLQRDLRPSGSPILVVLEGWDAAGKGMVLNRLLEPLDPRGFKVYNIKETTDVERMFPPLRRFWLTIPPRGGISIYNHSWYREVLQERVEEKISAQELQNAYEHIRTFERQLHDDGAVVIKFFLHISKKEQAKRFKRLEKDDAFAWKIGKAEIRRHKMYRTYYEASEDMLRETSTAYAPWTVIAATDDNFAKVRVAETMLTALQRAVAQKSAPEPAPVIVSPRRTSPLDRVDLNKTVALETYEELMPKLQRELRRLQHVCYFKRRAAVLIYEGWDAGGKGAQFAGSPGCSIRAGTKLIPSPPRRVKKGRIIIFGGFGARCRKRATSHCLIAVGTGAYSSSASKVLHPRKSGNGPTARSTSSNRNYSNPAQSC